MFSPFSEKLALPEAEKLMQELDSGLLDSAFGTDATLTPGQMFGVAVCKDSFGKRIVLRAFSGQLRGEGRWLVDGFVPPCIDVEKWKKEVERADPEIKRLTSKINELPDCVEKTELIAKRKELSRISLKNIYEMYEFKCWDGHSETYQTLAKSLVCEKAVGGVNSAAREKTDLFSIPTGTGDCCAPKLINYAFQNNLKILSLVEFFYGTEPASKNKKHKTFYPPCDEKCGILLPKMLGLEILYRDEDIIVVNKPSGLLSIPGRSTQNEDKSDSVATRVRKLFPNCIAQPASHRLDMDTSGLMVLGFTAESQRNLSMQFEARTVKKKYRALLRGSLAEKLGPTQQSGTIELKQRLDIENRPHQIVDEQHGKLAITHWKVLEETETGAEKSTGKISPFKTTLVEFTPETGRTHQLRLASAHPKGLGTPIVGDNLYGAQNEGERLCLQAFYLEFDHPTTGERLKFTLPREF